MTPAPPRSAPRLPPGIAYAITTTLLWAILPIGLKISLQFANASTIVWFRFAFAWVCLVGWLLWRDPKVVRAGIFRPPLLGIIAGLALGANYFGFMQGISLTTPGNTQILIQIGPMALIVVGLVMFKERLGRLQALGFGVAAFGIALFYHDQLNHFFASAGQYRLGNIWIVVAALTWTAYATLQKVLMRQYSPQHINLIIYGVAALMFTPLARFHELVALHAWQWGVLVFLGANTVIAYGMLGEAFKRAPANNVSMIITLNPILMLALIALLSTMDVAWVRPETMSPLGYVGAVGVVLGAILVVSRR